MYYVYVLINGSEKWYIGFTNNLQRRVSDHKSGKVYTTKRIGGLWKLVYYEVCLNQYDALRRERYLKSGRGRAYIKKRLKIFLKTRAGTQAVNEGRL